MGKGRQKTERDGKGYIREIRREIRLFSHHFGVASCPCSLFSSTEPGKKIASRPRERNIVLMSQAMLRYPFPRVPNVTPPSPPFPPHHHTPKPSWCLWRLTPSSFHFVSAFSSVCPAFSFALFLSSLDDSPPLIPDGNIQFASRLLFERDTCHRLFQRREEIFPLSISKQVYEIYVFENICNDSRHNSVSIISRCKRLLHNMHIFNIHDNPR